MRNSIGRSKNSVQKLEERLRTQSTTFRCAIRFSCSPTYPSQFQNAYSDPPVAQNYSITPVHRLMGASLETYGMEIQPQDIINARLACTETANPPEIFVEFQTRHPFVYLSTRPMKFVEEIIRTCLSFYRYSVHLHYNFFRYLYTYIKSR